MLDGLIGRFHFFLEVYVNWIIEPCYFFFFFVPGTVVSLLVYVYVLFHCDNFIRTTASASVPVRGGFFFFSYSYFWNLEYGA